MVKVIRRLPDAELEVMQAVWSCTPPVARADIERNLGEDRPMAPTTILTLLARLTQRGFLATDKRGRNNYYTPLVSQHEYLAAQSRRFLDKLCGGNLHAFAAALCDSGLSQADIDELRRLLEQGEL